MGDRDGDRSTTGGGTKEPGSRRAVQEQPVTVAGVSDRKDHRFAVKAQGDVGDQSGVEDLVEHRAVAHLAVAEPVHARPFSDWQQVCRHDCHCAREVV